MIKSRNEEMIDCDPIASFLMFMRAVVPKASLWVKLAQGCREEAKKIPIEN